MNAGSHLPDAVIEAEHPRPRTECDADRVVLKRVVTACASAGIGVSVVLAFFRLGRIGLSLDEWSDYSIAASYVRAHAFLENLSDPTQGRLGHLVAAASLGVFGPSYVAFKVPFVLLGAAGGFGIWRLLRRRVTPAVALLFTAIYASTPYVLAASRTAVTGGDVLVIALTVAFIATLEAWTTTEDFWFGGALCAATCGAATGAKWTCGLLAVAALARHVWLAFRRGKLRLGTTWTELFAFSGITAVCAVISSPTFLLGYDFVEGSLLKVAAAEKSLVMFQLGAMRHAAPWFYVPAVLVSKLSPIVILAAVAGVWHSFSPRAEGRKRSLTVTCLLSLLPMLPLVFKPFQNAHYYVGAVPAFVVCSALAFDHWLTGARKGAETALWCGGLLTLAAQLGLSIWLAPDFLQAGRQFGPAFEGQFMGPAVNHCQGGPLAIEAVNELTQESPAPVYHLTACIDALKMDMREGPIRAKVPIRVYPDKGRPPLPHYVLVSSMYDYRTEHELAEQRRRNPMKGCPEVRRGPGFKVYSCR